METTNPNDDGPKTLAEAVRYFADQDTCLNFLVQLRWPEGISCPRCGSTEHSFLSTRRLWKCKGCKKQFSVKVGTIMEDSPIGLDKWLTAMWLIANAKNGISSWELHRAIGVTQKSAWFLLHRIRLAMQTGTFGKLSGEVEVDETFIGGKARNMHADKRAEKIHGWGACGNAIVMGVLERGGEVRTKVIPDTRRSTLHTEVRDIRNFSSGIVARQGRLAHMNTSDSTPPDTSHFTAFRTLAAKLVQVPKAEADEQEAKYQKEQAKKPKRGPKPKK